MKIKSVQIKNFKKLKDVTIKLSDEQSIFVGANNSGKTSSMEAISKFLKREKAIKVYDFTIYNWPIINGQLKELNNIKEGIEKQEDNEEGILEKKYYETKKVLEELFPSLKVVIGVEEVELHKVIEIIPGLDEEIREVAVYFRFEPDNYDLLFKEYIEARKRIEDMYKFSSEKLTGSDMSESIGKQWPIDFKDFLESEGQLKKHFKIKAYLANPVNTEKEFPFDESTAYKGNPLENILKIDEINAQRGLSDEEDEGTQKIKKLSSQFTKYYNSFEMKNDINHSEMNLIKANHEAESAIGDQLNQTKEHLTESLLTFGYPGFGSPEIKVAPIIKVQDTMKNSGSVLFNVHPKNIKENDYYLPENSNGLGFQNLISIFFELIYFTKERQTENEENILKPLHLILIEEPEAHLHAQAQKVFVEKALEVIKKDQKKGLYTQVVMTTHSSHIADHANFDDLLYFKRKKDEAFFHEIEVVNLEDIELDPEGKKEDMNKRFVERYLQLAEHDIFFADGVILIEGASERIILPRMIEKEFPELQSKYLTIMEVGGAYAHLFFPLLERLGRPTLVITDIDSVENRQTKQGLRRFKTHTSCSESKFTSNGTLKKWFASDVTIKELLKKTSEEKVKDSIKITYQTKNHATNRRSKAYSRTFEDDFAMTNPEFFKKMIKPIGLSKKFKKLFLLSQDINSNVSKQLFNATDDGKTQFALDILYGEIKNEEKFNSPEYIIDGLQWLQENLDEENDRGEILDEA